MITLLASMTGFIGSLLPSVLKLFCDRLDKKHELEILDRQIAMKKAGMDSGLEEIRTERHALDSRALYKTYFTGIHWVDALNGSVRPVLAYAFFILYSSIKLAQAQLLVDAPAIVIYDILWSLEDQAIFAGIVSFYFGQRAISKIAPSK
jgi:hypothetical protein